MTPYPYELFEMIAAEASKEKKIEMLQNARNGNACLPALIKYIFDTDTYQFRVKNLPAYNAIGKGHPSMSYSTLYKEVRKFYVFLDNEETRKAITDSKLNNILIQMCEAIPEPEVRILESMFKDRKLPYKGLPKSLFVEAFPDLFPVVESKSEKEESPVEAPVVVATFIKAVKAGTEKTPGEEPVTTVSVNSITPKRTKTAKESKPAPKAKK